MAASQFNLDLRNSKSEDIDAEILPSVGKPKTLLKADFDYITDKDGIMLFRRPKKFVKLVTTDEA